MVHFKHKFKLMLKKCVAFMLIMSMVLSMLIPGNLTSAYAQTAQQGKMQENDTNAAANTAENSDVTLGSENVSIEGANAIGSLISNELSQFQTEQAMNGGYNVYEIKVSENVATVTYSAIEDCSMVVAIYDEANEQMLASGISQVTADATEVSIKIDTDEMPQYFIVRAYFVDTFNMKPLAAEYSSPMYTREMQELMAKTVDDFTPESVLNLDEDKTTNFMVYEETTILISSDENKNIVSLISEDANNTGVATYKIENADDSVRALKSGDIVSIGTDEDATILKVGNISIDGTTVTINSVGVDIEEVFAYVKIETSGDTTDAVVDEATCEEGLTYVGEISSIDTTPVYGSSIGGSLDVEIDDESFEVSGELEGAKEFEFKNFKYENDNEDVEVNLNGKVAVALAAELNIYISTNYQLVELCIGVGAYVDITFDGEIKSLAAVALAEINIPTGTIITITVAPKFIFKISGEMNVNAEIGGKIGFTYDSSSKDKLYPVLDAWAGFSISAQGAIALGLALDPSVSVMENDWLASIEADSEILLETSIEKEIIGLSTEDEEHACEDCVSGSLDITVSVSPTLELANRPVIIGEELGLELGVTFNLGKWYFSNDNNQFGFGECPNKVVKTALCNIFVKDKTGKGISDAKVIISGVDSAGEEYYKEYFTKDDGTLSVEVSRGNHIIEVRKEGYRSGTVKLYNWKYSRKISDIILTQLNYTDQLVLGNGFTIEKKTEYNNAYIGVIQVINDDFSVPAASFTGAEIGKVVIDDAVTTIPEGLFRNCKINEFVFRGGVETIDDYAFYSTTLPDDFIIPESVKNFGFRAFYGINIPIKKVVINEGGSLGNGAFMNSTVEKCIVKGEPAIIEMPFYGTVIENVEIDDTVTKIPKELFKQSEIKKIDISKSVTAIGKSAFSGAKLPAGFVLYEGITTIDAYAFSSAKLNNEIVIPSTVVSIGDGAFQSLNVPVDKVVLGEVLSIGYRAFMNTTVENISVESMEVAVDEPFYKCTVGNVEFGAGVTGIQDELFIYTTITAIELPTNITEIGLHSFERAVLPQSFKLPESIVKIGAYAFNYSNLPASFELTNGITEIGNYAFNNATFNDSIIIPETVKSIGEFAFALVKKPIAKLVLTDDMKLGYRAFDNATIEEFVVDGVALETDRPFYNATLKNVTIAEGLANIPNRLFEYSKINKIAISDSVIGIGEFAFSNATLPKDFEIPVNVKNIGPRAFANLVNPIKELVIYPEMSLQYYSFNNTTIEKLRVLSANVECKEAFWSTDIGEVEIDNEVDTISDMLFRGSVIDSIIIPSTVKVLEESSFSYAVLPEEFVIPEGVEIIGNSAFYQATLPSEMVIPVSVKKVDANAFRYTGITLREIVISAGMELGLYAFTNTTVENVLIEGEPAYSNQPFNGVTIGSVTISGVVSNITANMFRDAVIGDITIPGSVTHIGAYAFYAATLPEDFSVSDSVIVEKYAFTKSTYDYVEPARAAVQTVNSSAVEANAGVPEVNSGSVEVNTNFENNIFDDATQVDSTETEYIEAELEMESKTETAFEETESRSEEVEVESEDVESVSEEIEIVSLETEFTIEEIELETEIETETSTSDLVEEISESAKIVRAGTGNLTFASIVEVSTEASVDVLTEQSAEVESEIATEQVNEPESESATAPTPTPTLHTSTYSGLRPNDTYNLYVLKSKDEYMLADEMLSSDNLLCITQFTTDANGCATVNYMPEEEISDVVEFVACLSKYDISNATVEVEKLLYNGAEQDVVVTVTLNGATLELYEDYDISGEYTATDIGWHEIIVSGVNDYTGVVYVQYAMLPEDGTEIEPPTEEEPTQAPTEEPTQAPTEKPSEVPTEEPTENPNETPTEPSTTPSTGETGIILCDDNKYHYLVNGETDITMNGLYNWNGTWIYLEEGIWITNKYDFVDYNGGSFLVANGAVADLIGLVLFEGVWYYLANGQLINNYEGLTEYDSEWFYVKNGMLVSDYNGIKEYDGGLFLIAEGRILFAYSGLYQAADEIWYFIANGQVQTQYTGLALYDEKWFYVVDGILAVNYTGMVDYNGASFGVVNGMVAG